MPKFAPPPPVNDETWHALLAAAADFAATAPWNFVHESDLVGLIDPSTGETRIGSVLGSGGEVFAAVVYRRGGLRWILQTLSEEEPDPESLATVEGMDVLKLEFVPKKELKKEEIARLNAAGFKPAGRGAPWPQFRSAEPGWHPWHISQAEAGQLLADLPRLTAFCKMFKEHPALFKDRLLEEIPFLPAKMPERALTPEDLEWHPMVLPPESPAEPFRPAPEEMERLAALQPLAGAVFEFDSMLLPGASFVESGRPCYGRIALLVEKQNGMVLGFEFGSGAMAAAEAAARGLVKGLLSAGVVPEQLRIASPSLQPVLQPLCDTLNIKLRVARSLPALEEAMDALTQRFGGGPGPGNFPQ